MKDNVQHLRQLIAQQAARMMAEEGISDFAYAKKKAGKQLGAVEYHALPSNTEIEEALKLYNSLFLGETHPENLRDLRQNAFYTMQLLQKFNPHLTGAVLDGTAGLCAETQIHLFADSIKEVEMFLLNQQIPFDVNEKSYRIMNDGKRDKKGDYRKTVPVFTLETDTGLIKLSVFEVDDIRVTTKRPADGSNALRLNLDGVKALLEKEVPREHQLPHL